MTRSSIHPNPIPEESLHNPYGYDLLESVNWLRKLLRENGWLIRKLVLRGKDQYIWMARVKRSCVPEMKRFFSLDSCKFRFSVDIEDENSEKDEVIAKFYFKKPGN